MKKRKLLHALLMACVFTFIPLAISPIEPANRLLGALKIGVVGFLLPGTLIAVVATGGNVHTTNPWMLIMANLLFYFGVTYLLFRFLWKHGASARTH
jgi:hypothetical protein